MFRSNGYRLTMPSIHPSDRSKMITPHEKTDLYVRVSCESRQIQQSISTWKYNHNTTEKLNSSKSQQLIRTHSTAHAITKMKAEHRSWKRSKAKHTKLRYINFTILMKWTSNMKQLNHTDTSMTNWMIFFIDNDELRFGMAKFWRVPCTKRQDNL